MKQNTKVYNEGHFIGMWIGIGIAIFAGFGVTLSFALRMPAMIGIWPAMGVAIGVAIGSSVEERYMKEGRIIPRTKQQNNDRKVAVIVGVAFFLILAAALAIRFLM
jgi:hypothetical protein